MRSEVSSLSDGLALVVGIGASWFAIGLALAVVMGRRGHSSFGWLVVGTIMGPMAILFAIDARRHDERLHPLPLVPRRNAAPPEGPVDVLVGYDGSPESTAALDAAVALLGKRMGRVTVTTVVPYGDLPDVERAARKQLQHLARRRRLAAPDFEILHGHPSDALAQRAADGGYDLIVVGTRGAGVSKSILGSAASELARDSTVPVLLAGRRDHEATDAA
jgi:nucleotide-binding universal stress UspA family protein